MVTKSDENALTAAQEVAIAALLRGASVTDAANEAGVSRQAVSTWCHRDAEFIAAWNRARQEVWGAVEDRIRTLHTKALDAIERSLDGEAAADIALEVLRILSRMSASPGGATDPRDIRADWARQELYRQL